MDSMANNPLINSLAQKMAHAIAVAEGFYAAGSLPARIFNPGDMELGDRGYGIEQGKTIYLKADPNATLEDHTDGYSALRRECTAILTGCSHDFFPSFTFAQVALVWTGNDKPGAWCKIVTDNLNLNPITTIEQWVKGATTNASTIPA